MWRIIYPAFSIRQQFFLPLSRGRLSSRPSQLPALRALVESAMEIQHKTLQKGENCHNTNAANVYQASNSSWVSRGHGFRELQCSHTELGCLAEGHPHKASPAHHKKRWLIPGKTLPAPQPTSLQLSIAGLPFKHMLGPTLLWLAKAAVAARGQAAAGHLLPAQGSQLTQIRPAHKIPPAAPHRLGW